MSSTKWGGLEAPAALKQWRTSAKLSQQDAANLLGIDLASYNAFERGRQRPGIDIAAAMQLVTRGRVQAIKWAKPRDDESRRKTRAS